MGHRSETDHYNQLHSKLTAHCFGWADTIFQTALLHLTNVDICQKSEWYVLVANKSTVIISTRVSSAEKQGSVITQQAVTSPCKSQL